MAPPSVEGALLELKAMPTGYSPRALADKLGLKPVLRVALLQAPAGYAATLGPLPPGVELRRTARGRLDFVQLFVTRAADLARRLEPLRAAIFPDGVLWVSWPKKTSGVATDVTEDVVRALALPRGLVDVKVCAVDAVWSGLKLVVPLAQRGARSRRAGSRGVS